MEQKKANILIVDDEPNNVYSFQQLLAREDWNILTASKGEEALSKALNLSIDLIILDVHMPDMDGFEVAQLLKSKKRTKDIPIIFTSAKKKDHHFIIKGFEEGGMDYLALPSDPEITKAKVSALLQLHLQKKELAEKNLALEKYALLINNSADLIAIINPDNLVFEEVNEGVNILLEYLPREMKGTSLLKYVASGDHALIHKFRQEQTEKFNFTSLVHTKKGAAKWLEWNVVHRNGLWLANARDITTLKGVEEIKSHLAAFVKQSEDAVYLHGSDGEIISWNKGAEKMYGFSEAEALTMKIWNIVPPVLLSEVHELINDIFKGKKVESLETKRITKFGIIKEVMFSASLIADTTGTVKSVAITERDITHQKKAEQDILQLNADLSKNLANLEVINKELESFSYSVSHDLRSPLTNIIGYIRLIEDKHPNDLDPDLKNMLDIILDSAHRMDALIGSLLIFSRLGKQELEKKPVDFADLVAHVLQGFIPALQSGVKMQIGDLITTEGDYTLLYQVYSNLISNAIKYSGKATSPCIEIGSYEEGEEIVYFVKDNGAGFDMQYAHKLFNVFQRLHKQSEFEGTGVGLAIVQRIVAKHGGRIWAEGKVNEGAAFYFTLPKTNG